MPPIQRTKHIVITLNTPDGPQVLSGTLQEAPSAVAADASALKATADIAAAAVKISEAGAKVAP